MNASHIISGSSYGKSGGNLDVSYILISGHRFLLGNLLEAIVKVPLRPPS